MAVSILLVEDNLDVLEALRVNLSADGFAVTTAQNGVEALAALSAIQPDVIFPGVIITDIRMPDMDGLEFIKLVRSEPKSQQIPIIAMSAEDETTLEQAKAVGADIVLKKPIDADALPEIINGLLDHDKSEG